MFERQLQDLCQDYNVPYPDQFAICGRLKTTAGKYKVDTWKFPKGRITVSKKFLELNGPEVSEKVLLHEFVHHYLFHKYKDRKWEERRRLMGHTQEFKEMCAKIGGIMNVKMAGKEFAHAAHTNFVKTRYKWQYVCDNCGTSICKTKRAYSERELKKYQCGNCHISMNSNMKRKI